MNGDEDDARKGSARWSTSHLIEPDDLAVHRLRCRDAKADDDAWLDDLEFGFEPWPARGDLSGGRFFVFATLSLWLPFEMFDGIGEIHVASGDARFSERLVQDFPCRTDKGMAGSIFLIARLLADEQDRGMACPLTENGLGGAFIQIASRAFGGRLAELRHAQMGGDE